MIFILENIGEFRSVKGMMVNPQPCTLTDGRTGYWLHADVWNEELVAKGATIEEITKADIVISTEI